MGIDDDRKISRFVPERLPEFVRVDHPTLVAFLEAYYEWLELRRNSGVVLSPMALHDITDVDTSLDQFIDNFKQQYMLNFPESLAISPDTGKPVDERRLLKNIKQFYLAKGTEKSYEFLFRVFYDTNVEFYYPKNDILRLSSGRWVQNNFLRISNTIGDSIYRAAGNLIVQRNSSGQIIATARVINVNVYQIDNFDVAELLISGRNGTFQTGDVGIEFADGDETFNEVRVYSVVSTISIVSGGANYQIGDRVNFVSTSNDGGQRARGTVAEIDAAGGIRKINIDDFGINYSNPPAIQIESVRGTGFVGNVTVGSLCQAFGYYANNDGRLSTNKVLQDNHYYQNWSYVLKSEVVIDSYRELVRRLVHPSGTAMFGSVLVKRCSTADLRNATSMMSFRVPYIGNYAAYTPRTFDDLSVWFQKEQSGGLTPAGYDPNTHDVLIAGVGEGLVQPGNPLSNNILFAENDANALVKPEPGSPLWIVYPHANAEVDRGYHYARVWKNQARDVIRWREWFFNREDNYSDARYEWMKSIDSSLDLTEALSIYPRYSLKSEDGIFSNVSEGDTVVLRSWGNNDYGQTNVPPNLGFIKDAANGFLHTVALDINGNVRAWGAGSTTPPTNVSPDFGQSIVPSDMGQAIRVGAGYYHSIAQLADGTLRLWGNNSNGQCNVPTNLVVSDFDGGGFHTVVCLPDGTVRCFGAGAVSPVPNQQPEYGQGVVPSVVSDVNHPNFVPVVQVSAGLYFTIVLRSDGSLVAWGDNLYGQCTIPQGLGNVAKIRAGRSHSLAMLDDGSVVCWGGFTNNQENIQLQTIPAELGSATDIAAGFRVNGAIDQNGKVFVWGSSSAPESFANLNVPTDVNPSSRIWGKGRHLSAGAKKFECCIPGFDCNEGCEGTAENPCIPFCDCIGGTWKDGICTCPDGFVGVWSGTQFVCQPHDQEEETAQNTSCLNCICGFRNYSLTAHAGTMLSYDENSEFGKITLRAFLNMPEGQAFDCREEEILGVSLPEIIIETPTSGQVIQTSDSDLPLHIEYTISNAENLGYYRAVGVNVYIDNRIKTTLSVNDNQVTLIGVANGRRTLKMELVDSGGKLVAGTQKVLLFGYQYIQPT